MDAPNYPPATHYVAPTPAPVAFGADTLTVQEADRSEPVRKILLEEAPQLQFILRAPQVQSHASNWSIHSLSRLNLISTEELARIETRLQALPAEERPVL